jgi:ankyrin repeat protein
MKYSLLMLTILSFNMFGMEPKQSFQESGTPALVLAARYQNLQHVKTLLRQGSWVNNRDGEGNTALHYAVRKGNVEIINELLKYEPDINRQNNKGKTALDIAWHQYICSDNRIAHLIVDLLQKNDALRAKQLK